MSSSLTRITGMYSGFDTDQLIKDLMKAESVKVDKVKQDKIYAEWQQEAYRDIINDIRGLKDEYFSFTNMDKNFRSSTAFTSYDSIVEINGTSSSDYVSVSAGSGVQPGNHTINKITLGKKSIWKTGIESSNNISGNDVANYSLINNGDTFQLTVDETEKPITLDGGYSNITDLKNDLQIKINSAFGSGNITVSESNGKIAFSSASSLTINNTNDGDFTIEALGFGKTTANMKGSDITGKTINANETFDLVLDGNRKTITIPNTRNLSTAEELTNLVSDLQNQIDNAFGSDKINVTESGGQISFASAGHTLKITNTNDGDTTVDSLGFTVGDQNTLDLGKTLQDANFANSVSETVAFTINGVDFSFNAATDTIQNVINQVNSSDAGVTLSYSSLTDKFTLQSDSEGEANNISISGSFLETTLGLSKVQDATDAKFTLDGVETTRSSNTFTIDGLEYALKSDYDPDGTQSLDNIDVNISSNPDELVDKIKGFVDKYNELIGKINTELTEKRYYDYDPLTDEQKKELTEDEVKKWEEKAKSGLLKSDSSLESMLRNMRSVLYDSVDGLALYDIGITTSSDYKDKGKLIIDEEKLKKAIQDKPNQVANLFSKEDEGLANKFYDIIEDNISTSTDSYGRKGLLLEKAGIEGDRTAKDNLLSNKIKRYEDTIVDLLEDLNDKENYYYTMFAKMEKALAEMNSQSSFFTSQMG